MQQHHHDANAHEQHIVLVGALYMDTILSVPHFPEEDSKLRATSLSVRRGGNCPNSLEVLQQLLRTSSGSSISSSDDKAAAATPAFSGLQAGRGTRIQTHLVSPLPGRASAATAQIKSSFGVHKGPDSIDFSRCLYHEGHEAPASSYVLRSAATGSRTVVNHNDLPEMTVEEFTAVVESLQAGEAEHDQGRRAKQQRQWWWHFEGRVPDTTLECMRVLRRAYGRGNDGGSSSGGRPGDDNALRISVEVEKPGRQGLRELAAEADIVFYSRSWAEHSGYASPEECLREQRLPRASLAFCTWAAEGAACLDIARQTCFRSRPDVTGRNIDIVDTVGAGDTFVAGVLYGLIIRVGEWDPQTTLDFAVELATSKVQQEGFQGLEYTLAR